MRAKGAGPGTTKIVDHRGSKSAFEFAIIGMAYFVYGKRAQRLIFVVAGVGPCVYPYLVGGVPLELLVGSSWRLHHS